MKPAVFFHTPPLALIILIFNKKITLKGCISDSVVSRQEKSDSIWKCSVIEPFFLLEILALPQDRGPVYQKFLQNL